MRGFKIGDKLFHPVYGTGTLVDLKKDTGSEDGAEYLVISLTAHDGRFMIPLDRVDESGVRKVIQERNRPSLGRLFGGRPRQLSDNHLKRRQEIEKRLTEARFKDIGHLIRDLASRQATSGLNAYERRVLKRAKGLLAQEFAASEDIDTDTAMEQIDAALERRLSRSQEQGK